MDHKTLTKRSKRLSYVLRHKPESANIKLDAQGFTSVQTLLDSLKWQRDDLDFIVKNNNKKRFEFSDDGLKIRARQGHSIDVDLGYKEIEPPDFLYHGTTKDRAEAILSSQGLEKMKRHHVHLSPDVETAKNVGSRHGKPVILTILAKQMYNTGYKFYKTKNNVWLVDSVPVRYINS